MAHLQALRLRKTCGDLNVDVTPQPTLDCKSVEARKRPASVPLQQTRKFPWLQALQQRNIIDLLRPGCQPYQRQSTSTSTSVV